MPNVLLSNARSLVNKINEQEIQIASHNSDVTVVTETWLEDQVPDEAVMHWSIEIPAPQAPGVCGDLAGD